MTVRRGAYLSYLAYLLQLGGRRSLKGDTGDKIKRVLRLLVSTQVYMFVQNNDNGS